MKERWINLSDAAAEKQNQQFDVWQAAENIRFASDEAKACYQQQVGMIRDAINLYPLSIQADFLNKSLFILKTEKRSGVLPVRETLMF